MSDAQNTTTGWIIFIASLGMMMGLLSSDISRLPNWDEAFKPAFVGIVMAHLAVVITAFVGGKIIPDQRTQFGRVTDNKLKEIQNVGNNS